MKYDRSFYYWAAFISHGFASVKLDDALLDQIHNRLKSLSQASGHGGADDSERAFTEAMIALTQDAYRTLGHQEHILLSKWCEKWHTMTSGR